MPRKKRDSLRFSYGDDEYIASTEAFAKRIKEILDSARRLAEKEAQGFRYKRIWVKKSTVKQHTRRGYFVHRPVRGKT